MIKQTVESLIKRFGSNDPFKIAEHYATIQIHEVLLDDSVRGFYQYYMRNRLIYLNGNLPDPIKRIVCAHELGHAFLHPKTNSVSLRAYTFLSVDKLERQANQFAAELLLPDEIFSSYEGKDLHWIAASENLLPELVQMKSNILKKQLHIY